MWKRYNMGRRSKSTRHCTLAGKDCSWKDTRSKYHLLFKLHFMHYYNLQLAATLDLFPTITKLTGGKLPNVSLDGFDMSPILFSSNKVSLTLHSNIPNDL